jgi:hypothetical protein
VVTAAWRVQVNLAVRAALVLLLVGFARSLLGVCPPPLVPCIRMVVYTVCSTLQRQCVRTLLPDLKQEVKCASF